MAIAVSALTLAGLAVPVSAATAAAAQPAGAPPVSVAITSVSPTYATPGGTVTVSGTLTNSSNRTMSGLSIQLRSSGTPFDSRGELQEYADGTFLADEPVAGAVTTLKQPLARRATVPWTISLPVNARLDEHLRRLPARGPGRELQPRRADREPDLPAVLAEEQVAATR